MNRKQQKSFILFIIIPILLLTGLVQAQSVPPTQVRVNYPAAVETEDAVELSVFFTLTDEDGRPVVVNSIDTSTIQLFGDTTLYDTVVEKPSTPFYVALVLDASGSMSGAIDDMRAAAKEAIAVAPPAARFAVIQFNEEIEVIQGFTNNTDSINFAIDQVDDAPLGTCLFDATGTAINLLNETAASPEERRAVILFTDGKDQLRVGDNTPCSRSNIEDVLRLSRQPNAFTAIHTIGMANTDGAVNAAELERMASETGGFSAIGVQDSLGELFSLIIQGLNEQWVARARIFPKAGETQATLGVTPQSDGPQLTTTFNFFSSRDYNVPPPPVAIAVRSLQYSAEADLYNLSLGIGSPEVISRLVVSVWDERRGVQISPELAFDNPSDSQFIELTSDGLEAERTYLIKVQAVDANGFFIADEEGNSLLAEVEFVYEPPQIIALEGRIESISANYETAQLIIDTAVNDETRIQTYQGFIVRDETGERVADLPQLPYPGRQIVLPLPPAIAEAPQPESYRVTIFLNGTAGEQVELLFEDFSPIPPAPPGFFARILGALANQLWITGAIGVILLAVIGFFLVRRQRANKRRDGVPPPPVAQTMVFSQSMMDSGSSFGDSSGGGMGDYTIVDTSLDDLFDEADMGDRTEIFDEGMMTLPQVRIRVTMCPDTSLVGQEFTISRFPFSVGREGCDLSISKDGRISRRHMEVGIIGTDAMITDLNSRNGTFLNDERLFAEQTRPLPPGISNVRLGTTTSFEIEQIS
ncbi:MAG: VWA domain-containing protein [Ardenticatenaceae bacterium]|nr:VWA domain-containing protein [Ardenticatenaceae bacterium]